MNKAVQEAVQDRDGDISTVPLITKQVVRAEGERAILVSERSARWDKPAAAAAPVDPMAEIADPLWNNHEGTVWTPDLVYCRLLVVAEWNDRLPGVIGQRIKSFLGNLVVSGGDASERKPPLSPQQISLADWTWIELLKLPTDRMRLLLSRSQGVSFAKISAAMIRLGNKRAKPTTVKDWDREERRILAARWQAARQPVDFVTYDKWRELFERRK